MRSIHFFCSILAIIDTPDEYWVHFFQRSVVIHEVDDHMLEEVSTRGRVVRSRCHV
jgi:hypothetical protein